MAGEWAAAGGRDLLPGAARRRAQTNWATTVAEAAGIVARIGNPGAADDAGRLRRRKRRGRAGGGAAASAALPSGLIAHVHLNDRNRRGPARARTASARSSRALQRARLCRLLRRRALRLPSPTAPTCAARAIGYLQGVMEADGMTAPTLHASLEVAAPRMALHAAPALPLRRHHRDAWPPGGGPRAHPAGGRARGLGHRGGNARRQVVRQGPGADRRAEPAPAAPRAGDRRGGALAAGAEHRLRPFRRRYAGARRGLRGARS